MRILFITASRIGDAVLSTGVLAHLAAVYPEARFTIACGTVAAPLFGAMPFVERVIPMTKKRYARHWLALWAKTVLIPWTLVVDLRGSAMGWLVPTRRRCVLRSSNARRHRLAHLASVLGLAEPLPPRLWATAAQDKDAARLVPEDGPVLAVGPTANWGGKIWAAERFAEAATRLTGPDGILPGARVAVFASASESHLARPVLEAIPADRRIDLVGNLDLPTVYACLRRCAFYLGNDSGLMHIAAAAGIPTLGLFGPSPEVSYAPWGPKTATVRGPRSYEDICRAPDFDHRQDHSRMLDLDIDKVVAAARTLWARAAD